MDLSDFRRLMIKDLKDSAGIIPLILLMLVGIVGLFIFLLVRSC
jgi:hypothetical protein